MRPVKVFLAASKEEELPAEAFETELKRASNIARLDIDVCPWYRDATFPPGKDYLSSLVDHCRGCEGVKPSDFFAVILSDKEERASACLFELGLFLGGLGFEPQRCFMLSTRGDQALPQILRGRTHISFRRPSDINDSSNWEEAMKEPAKQVRNRIKELRAFAHAGFQVMSAETLMDLEAPMTQTKTGQLTDEAEVLVNRAQPIEESQRPFAACVLCNMKQGVKYRYFFHEKEAFESIARLIHTLATVVPDKEDPRKPATGGTVPQNVIADNLRVLQQQLSINLIPSPGPIEFCVHNVNDPGRAKCYLRYPFSEKFIQWCIQKDAIYIASELTHLSVDDTGRDAPFILRSTKNFDLNTSENEEIKKRYWNAIRRRFKDDKLNVLLREVCFERLTEEETRRWSRNSWESVEHLKAPPPPTV